FASTDNQAELPADYLYDQGDQGIHEFALAVIFNTIGKHSLSVHDLTDFRIQGNIDFEVVDTLDDPVDPVDPSVEILQPSPGTYRSARVTITGKSAGSVERVRIMDGAIVLVQDLEVDQEGGFVYQTAALANGVHEFQAFDMENQAQSQKVQITIDRLPPRVLAVEIDPSKAAYDPGESFRLKVSGSEPLSRADCVLLENNYQLVDQGAFYLTTMQAPLECGDYVIGCAVADKLGNELNEPNASRIKVCAPEEVVVIGGTGGEPEPVIDIEPKNIPPTAPINLTGLPDVDKVTLFWSPSTDDQGVAQYKINYGTIAGNLNQVNLVPDNRTRWYIDGLLSDVTYYFNVTAIDLEGNESDPSNTIEVRTLPQYKMAGDDDLDKTGPGWLMSLIFAFFGVLLIRFGMARDSL
ncbi:MAG TPA: fibronectin type III domain-containing protein, partial [Candidatus Gracilibacteria bacterium]